MSEELKALEAERAELMAKNAAATSWGAAVGARSERIKEIDQELRRLAAPDQKPLWLYEDDLPDGYPYGAMFEHSEVRNGVRMFPVYLSPPPAAGWDGSRWRHKKRGSTYTEIGRGKMQAENWLDPDIDGDYDSQSIDMAAVVVYRSDEDGSLWVRPVTEFEDGRFEALRHNAPPDSGAGKLDPSSRILEGLTEALAVTKGEIPAAAVHVNGHKYVPDHGGADAGVGEDNLREAFNRVANKSCRASRTWPMGDAIREEIIELADRAVSNPYNLVGELLATIRTLHSELGAKFDEISKYTPNDHAAQQAARARQKGLGLAIEPIERTLKSLSEPAPVDANASAEAREQWMTKNPDGSISLDAYAGWSRDKLKGRVRELVHHLTDWQFHAMKASSCNGNQLENVPEPSRTEIKRLIDAYSDEDEEDSPDPHASDCDKQGER